jgi:hypothetical protein
VGNMIGERVGGGYLTLITLTSYLVQLEVKVLQKRGRVTTCCVSLATAINTAAASAGVRSSG